MTIFSGNSTKTSNTHFLYSYRCSLAYSGCCIMACAGCHVLSKSIFMMLLFFPWTFLLLSCWVQTHPLVAAWLWHLCMLPQSGIIQTSALQHEVTQLLSFPSGKKLYQKASPIWHMKIWKATSLLCFLSPSRLAMLSNIRRDFLMFVGGVFMPCAGKEL